MSDTAKRKPRSRANGEGTVYALPNGRHQAQAVVGWNGTKHVYKRRTFDTVKEARVWLVEVKAALTNGLCVPDDKRTVDSWLTDWLSTLPGKVSAGTVGAYEARARNYIKPHLGGISLRKLTPRRVSTWLADLSSAGLSPSTCQGAYSTLRRALTIAQQEGLLSRNVAAITDGPRTDGRTARWTTPDEVTALLRATRPPSQARRGRPPKSERLAVAVSILAGTGVRRGELLGLKWDDLELEADRPTVTIRRQVVRRPQAGLVLDETKTGKTRTLPLPAFVVDALRDHRRVQAAERLAVGPLWIDNDLVIATEDGQPVDPRNLSKALERLAKRAGIAHVNPHALRHGAVSLLLVQGVSLEIASEIAGHSSIRVTKDVYGHLLTEHLSVAADAFDRAFRPAAGDR
ncbi:MAG: site-specific integrase [Myxococcota bacterium]|nr:site-specific integrase [Acidimicrobiia bacterium]MDQ3369368.1 site-specific integrase [Myxococcota bacterium]